MHAESAEKCIWKIFDWLRAVTDKLDSGSAFSACVCLSVPRGKKDTWRCNGPSDRVHRSRMVLTAESAEGMHTESVRSSGKFSTGTNGENFDCRAGVPGILHSPQLTKIPPGLFHYLGRKHKSGYHCRDGH